MKALATVIAIAGRLFSIVSPGRAQGTEWEALTQEGLELSRAGKYDYAIVVGNVALAVAEKNAGPDHPDVATSLENLAVLYRATQSDKEAEKVEQRAASIRVVQR